MLHDSMIRNRFLAMRYLTHTVRQSKKRHLTPFLLCALLVTGSVGAGRSDAATRPNVLLIFLDNIGKDWFRCYGSQEDVTPHFDQLAREQ